MARRGAGLSGRRPDGQHHICIPPLLLDQSMDCPHADCIASCRDEDVLACPRVDADPSALDAPGLQLLLPSLGLLNVRRPLQRQFAHHLFAHLCQIAVPRPSHQAAPGRHAVVANLESRQRPRRVAQDPGDDR